MKYVRSIKYSNELLIFTVQWNKIVARNFFATRLLFILSRSVFFFCVFYNEFEYEWKKVVRNPAMNIIFLFVHLFGFNEEMVWRHLSSWSHCDFFFCFLSEENTCVCFLISRCIFTSFRKGRETMHGIFTG